MKRFVTYLFEYENGSKAKNVGFVRVDIRREMVNMEVCIRNYMREASNGKIYGLVQMDSLYGVELDEIMLQAGQCNKRMVFNERKIAGGEYNIKDFVGLAIYFESGAYIASCWDDAWASDIARENFLIKEEKEILCECKEVKEESSNASQQAPNVQICETQEDTREETREETSMCQVTYKKIEPSQIRELPSANWHLDNNSFLIHGVMNYGFLFLKKEVREGEERYWLGVPGYFEKPELLMAVLFGFPEFEAIPRAIVDLGMNQEESFLQMSCDKEKNQKPKTGIFGGWFVLLDN